MDYHYSHPYLMGYSDVDKDNRMKLSRMIDLLQDVATWHSKGIGYGTEEMMELKLGWLLLAWKIKILSYPKADTKIEIRTWSRGMKGLHACRDYEILDEAGNTCVLATSTWVLFDLAAQRIIRPPEEMMKKYGAIERKALEEDISKIKEEAIDGTKTEIVIGKRDIDTNGHTNNARYMEFMMEVLPEDFVIHELEIHYKKQTRYGEKLYLTFDGETCTMKTEDGETHVIAKIFQ